MCRPQTFSHYPAWPAPIELPLVTIPEHDCAYFDDRLAMIRAFRIRELPPEVYHAFMDAGFRRSGRLIYQPVCKGCRRCVPLRVPAARFSASKSQRRCWRRNADLLVSVGSPICTDEKFELYQRYLEGWHDRDTKHESRENFEEFLYDSPVDSIEFQYRNAAGVLLAVGICDRAEQSLSSVYFYFDPEHRRRGLGTFGALCEVEYARAHRIPFLYLGYWVLGCRAMEYKCSFRPCQILGTDGVWRELNAKATGAGQALV